MDLSSDAENEGASRSREGRSSAQLQIAAQLAFGASLLIGVWLRVGSFAAVAAFVLAEGLVFGVAFAYLRRDRRKHRVEDAAWLLSCPAARRTNTGRQCAGRMHIGNDGIEWSPGKEGPLPATRFDYSAIAGFDVITKPFWSSVLSLELRGGTTERLAAPASGARVREALREAGATTRYETF